MRDYYCFTLILISMNALCSDSAKSDLSITSSYYSSSSDCDQFGYKKYPLVKEKFFEVWIDFDEDNDDAHEKAKNEHRKNPIDWLGYKIFNNQKQFLEIKLTQHDPENFSIQDIAKQTAYIGTHIHFQQKQIRELYSLLRKSYQAIKHLEAEIAELKQPSSPSSTSF